MIKRLIFACALAVSLVGGAFAQNVPATITSGSPGSAAVSTGGGAYAIQSFDAPITNGGAIGGYTLNTVLVSYTATNKGHFIQLQCVNNTTGSCTTPPQVNVFDGTSGTGTALTCGTTAQTKGTATTQTETLAYAAGDIIGIYVSSAGGTCTAPIFTVSAETAQP